MTGNMNSMHRNGTVSLETAISFSVVLVFITAIISVTVFLRTDILMQRAVHMTCFNYSHYTPFSITAADGISTLANALPDNAAGNDEYERIGSLISGMDQITGGTLRASVLNVMLGQKFTDDVTTCYLNYNDSRFFAPEEIYVDFSIEDFYISVFVIYNVNTIVGPVSREIVSTIPFYGDFELFLSGSESSDDGTDIWNQDNFSRGRFFAQRYGANLPSTFPVINYFNSGEAGSIVSLDLNKPTYSSVAACTLRVTREIDQLSSFDGASVNINGSRYTVNGSDISARTLIVVIPQDSPESGRLSVEALGTYASSRGVNLRIEEFGNSATETV